MSEKTRFDFEDIWFTVIAEPESHHVNYKIYSIVGVGDDGPVFFKDYKETTDNPGECEAFAHGYVKWDGCSNWDFDGCKDVMIHRCDRAGLVNIGEVLARCWDLTATLCPHWLG